MLNDEYGRVIGDVDDTLERLQRRKLTEKARLAK